jgi:hypothetical protein
MKGEWSNRGRILDQIGKNGRGHVYGLHTDLHLAQSSVHQACLALCNAKVLKATGPLNRNKTEYYLTEKGSRLLQVWRTAKNGFNEKTGSGLDGVPEDDVEEALRLQIIKKVKSVQYLYHPRSRTPLWVPLWFPPVGKLEGWLTSRKIPRSVRSVYVIHEPSGYLNEKALVVLELKRWFSRYILRRKPRLIMKAVPIRKKIALVKLN